MVNGQIVYATDGTPNSPRLADYLHLSPAETALAQLIHINPVEAFSTPEYGRIWALLETHSLLPEQARSIISHMIQETLFDLVGLHQGVFVFELSPPLTPQLCSLEISPLLHQTVKQIQDWKRLYPLIQSPDQCPLVTDRERLQEALSGHTFAALERYADGNTSIRQIARYLTKNSAVVARAIYPYVQAGAIQLISPSPRADFSLEPAEPQTAAQTQGRLPKVVCIDDSETVLRSVESILQQSGYEVTTIANPFDAFSIVFKQQPDLILCDITMPELDGYELCAMLRRSSPFHQTPIIMLTGKDGFIDRVWAHLSGATDYLTKPFREQELLMLVEKYIGSAGNSQLQVQSESANFNLPMKTN
jgi:twitching motility two-component system response regulator PilG